jgi:hypothetical protein
MPVYPGSGKAHILSSNNQAFLFNGENIITGQQSIAFQLERTRGGSYPWGAAFQVKFSGDPGTFEIDILGSETDEVNSYIKLATTAQITAVNASRYGRYDMPNTLYPKYVAALMQNLSNAVSTILVVTR